jgi:glutathione S-transferase
MSATDETSPYELLYWPGIPGRGEFIRLAFEAASVSYRDVSNEQKDGEQSSILTIPQGSMPYSP